MAATGACGYRGALVVDLDLEGHAQLVDQQGFVLASRTFKAIERSADRLSPFSGKRADLPHLSVQFEPASAQYLSIWFGNTGNDTVLLKLGEARYRTNLGLVDAPAPGIVRYSDGGGVLVQDWRAAASPATIGPIPLQSNKHVVLTIESAAGRGERGLLFPSGFLFNLQLDQIERLVVESGIDSSLQLSIPLVVEARPYSVLIKLKSVAVHPRRSYF